MLPTTSKKIIKQLKKEGWELVRTKGSHHQFKNKDHAHLITVMHPKKDFAIGTLNRIYKDAGWK